MEWYNNPNTYIYPQSDTLFYFRLSYQVKVNKSRVYDSVLDTISYINTKLGTNISAYISL